MFHVTLVSDDQIQSQAHKLVLSALQSSTEKPVGWLSLLPSLESRKS